MFQPFGNRKEEPGHREAPIAASAASVHRIVLVGSPNVGKSVLFANLTGYYATVSNYPGTTVSVAESSGRIEDFAFDLVDTPGMYSFLPLTEEERVTRRILQRESFDKILHVVDAKNLDRSLMLTFQLIEAGLPVILVLNMMDEARARGLDIDTAELEERLGIPVVGTVCTSGEGMDALRKRIREDHFRNRAEKALQSFGRFETYVSRIQDHLTEEYPIAARSVALLLLQGDREIQDMVRSKEPEAYRAISAVLEPLQSESLQDSAEYIITTMRKERAQTLYHRVVSLKGTGGTSLNERISGWLMHPLTGIPVLFAILYFGLYKFVGVFGAGTVVDYIEMEIFGKWINPYLTQAFEATIPWQAVSDLFVGPYGILTLGLRYGIAIIMPVVTLFFLVFAVIEDSGYLPRLSFLLDRIFKKIGLSGRAVIPMVLGFGCDTMATMVTRTLPSKREQLISIVLLSVAVPCSAQLGVIVGLLSTVPGALITWAGIMSAIYLLVGTLSSMIIPGRTEPFYMEVAPLRRPQLGNVLSKTFIRLKWYLKEIIPLFMLASVLIWLGQLTGLFGAALDVLHYPVSWIGLPQETSQAFLFGFFRRDYGVAGLYDLHQSGAFTGVQLLISAVTLTLFMPCIAQLLMTVREKGWQVGLIISANVLLVAFGTAIGLSWAFQWLGITL